MYIMNIEHRIQETEKQAIRNLCTHRDTVVEIGCFSSVLVASCLRGYFVLFVAEKSVGG